MKNKIHSILLTSFCIITSLNAQVHTVIYSNGDRITVGAPKGDFSWDHKTTSTSSTNNSSKSSSSGSGNGSGVYVPKTYTEQELKELREKYEKEEKAKTDAMPSDEYLIMKKAAQEADFKRFFELYNDPKTKFSKSGLDMNDYYKKNIAHYLILRLQDKCKTDLAYLTDLYKLSYEKKFGAQKESPWGDPFYDSNTYTPYDIYERDLCIFRAFIVMGEYQKAIDWIRHSKAYGKKSKYGKKETMTTEYYYFVNNLAGRCFKSLNMPDSAKRYLKLGEGFDAEYDKLVDYTATWKNNNGK